MNKEQEELREQQEKLNEETKQAAEEMKQQSLLQYEQLNEVAGPTE